MSAHTPGPWEWDWHPDKPDCVIALHDIGYAESDVLLCTGDETRAWGEISAEDARLIAAAPDLLKALSDLREAATEAYKAGRIAAEPFVRAGNVIAKAEGR